MGYIFKPNNIFSQVNLTSNFTFLITLICKYIANYYKFSFAPTGAKLSDDSNMAPWFGTAAGLRKLPAGSGRIYYIRRCRDCGACFSLSKFGCADRFRTNNARPCTYQELVNLVFIICVVSGRSANFLGEISRFNSCALLCSRGLTIVTVFLRATRPLRSHFFSGFYTCGRPSRERPEHVRSREIDVGGSSLDAYQSARRL